MDETIFVICPVCGGKTRQKMRKDTMARNLPVFCSKCKRVTVIDINKGFKITYII